MSGIGGFGVTANIIVTGASVALVDLDDIDLPEFEKFLVEATTHGATGGYSRWIDTGQKAMNPMKMTLLWDKSEASHTLVLSAFSLTSGVSFSLVTPGSDETIFFNAHIQKVGRIAKLKDKYKAEVTVQPTSAPTLS